MPAAKLAGACAKKRNFLMFLSSKADGKPGSRKDEQNAQRSTPNAERRTVGIFNIGRWTFSVGRSAFSLANSRLRRRWNLHLRGRDQSTRSGSVRERHR